jgi:diaminopimelate decarboxylase
LNALRVTVAELIEEHGSPLWLADVDRVRENHRAFRAVWEAAWPDVVVSYSYKTNRTLAVLRALHAGGARPEVVCAAEYALAVDAVGADGAAVTLNGPAKGAALLARAAADGALVVADTAAELDRMAAAGVRRAGLRVGLAAGGPTSRFGLSPAEVVGAGRRAVALGMELEALCVHLVSTDFTATPSVERALGTSVRVGWAKPPALHADAARALARLAAELAAHGVAVGTIDLGGGLPAAPEVAGHAEMVAAALRGEGFEGRLVLEPGRALVADAVTLAATVLAVKELDDGRSCAVLDAGTNLLPATLWGWPRLEPLVAAGADGPPVLVAGPLCLNVDVVHPAASLGAPAPGDVVLARDAGAYQQVQSTQFGDLRPAVVAREDGRWRLSRRREELSDLLAGETA